MNNEIYVIEEDNKLIYFTYTEEESVSYIKNIFKTCYLEFKSESMYFLDKRDNVFVVLELDTMDWDPYERELKSFKITKLMR